MTEIIRSADAPPQGEPAFEVVTVEGLGAVKVRALRLSERLQIKRKLQRAGDETEALVHIPFLLELSVVDADNRPLYSASGWEVFGASREGELACIELFNTAWRISDLGLETAAKNSKASRS